MPRPQRLLIVEGEIHYAFQGRLHAYGPYAREIDIWADLFPEVVIAAPVVEARPPGHCLPFTRENISTRPQWRTGGTSLASKAFQAAMVPAHLVRLATAMRDVDAIHVRCPSNLPLLGLLLAPLFSRRLVGKYTSQWHGGRDEPWSWRLQRALLRSRWFRGPVTVYGRLPDQPPNIVPFFTSILDSAQAARAAAAAESPRPGGPLRVLYVGRLTENKNVDIVLEAIARLADTEIRVECTVVGEGPERARLEALASRRGIAPQVAFRGGVSFDAVLDCYERADVLTLVSNSEGWGKSLTEAMAFGLVCIGSNTGVVPELLADGRGVVVPARDAAALAETLRDVASRRAEYEAMRRRAAAWAQQFTLDGLRTALGALLDSHWHLEPQESLLRAPPAQAFA